MKIFNRSGPWTSKVNFIDENNVALGYELDQECCESAGWFIADKVAAVPLRDEKLNITEHPNCFPKGGVYELRGWIFDPEFRAVITHDELEDGRMVVFRIKNGCEEKFIHIFNSQNGYYSHGFTFSGQGFITVEDSI